MSTGLSTPAPLPAPQQNPAFCSPAFRRLLVSVVLTLLGALAIHFLFFEPGRRESRARAEDDEMKSLKANRDADIAALGREAEKAREELGKLRKQTSEEKSQRASLRARVTRVRSRALQVKGSLKELRAKLTAWQATYQPLFTNESGRRLAARSPDRELALRAIERTRPSDKELENWFEELAILIEPLELAWQAKDPDAVVVEQHEAQIEMIGKSTGQALGNLDLDCVVVDSLLEGTKYLDPGDQTLAQAMNARKVELEKAFQEAMDRAVREAMDERAKQHASDVLRQFAYRPDAGPVTSPASQKTAPPNVGRREDDSFVERFVYPAPQQNDRKPQPTSASEGGYRIRNSKQK